MENPFKNITRNEKLPDSLKGKVIDDILLIKLSMDMADLGLVKYPEALADIFGALDSPSKKNNKNKNH